MKPPPTHSFLFFTTPHQVLKDGVVIRILQVVTIVSPENLKVILWSVATIANMVDEIDLPHKTSEEKDEIWYFYDDKDDEGGRDGVVRYS